MMHVKGWTQKHQSAMLDNPCRFFSSLETEKLSLISLYFSDCREKRNSQTGRGVGQDIGVKNRALKSPANQILWLFALFAGIGKRSASLNVMNILILNNALARLDFGFLFPAPIPKSTQLVLTTSLVQIRTLLWQCWGEQGCRPSGWNLNQLRLNYSTVRKAGAGTIHSPTFLVRNTHTVKLDSWNVGRGEGNLHVFWYAWWLSAEIKWEQRTNPWRDSHEERGRYLH